MNSAELAEKLDDDGNCVICRTPAEPRTRGLCRMHHGRFVRALSQLSDNEQQAFETMLIRQGRLLPSRRGRKLSTDGDEFAESLAKFRAAGGNVEQAVADHMTAITGEVKAIEAKELEANGAEANVPKKPARKGAKKAET